MSVFLVTGIQASGKSTVAEALAHRLDPPSAHVHGDQFRRWIVHGRREMTPDADPHALEQLRLRHVLAARAADGYAAAGCSVVVQDVVLGPFLDVMIDEIAARPLRVVVLTPDPDVAARRQSERGKATPDVWSSRALDRILREQTPRRGLWLDTSRLTVAETVAAILDRAAEAEI